MESKKRRNRNFRYLQDLIDLRNEYEYWEEECCKEGHSDGEGHCDRCQYLYGVGQGLGKAMALMMSNGYFRNHVFTISKSSPGDKWKIVTYDDYHA